MLNKGVTSSRMKRLFTLVRWNLMRSHEKIKTLVQHKNDNKSVKWKKRSMVRCMFWNSFFRFYVPCSSLVSWPFHNKERVYRPKDREFFSSASTKHNTAGGMKNKTTYAGFAGEKEIFMNSIFDVRKTPVFVEIKTSILCREEKKGSIFLFLTNWIMCEKNAKK